MILYLPMLRPRGKISELAIISVVRKPHFGADHDDFSAIDDNSTIVVHVLVDDGPDNVDVRES